MKKSKPNPMETMKLEVEFHKNEPLAAYLRVNGWAPTKTREITEGALIADFSGEHLVGFEILEFDKSTIEALTWFAGQHKIAIPAPIIRALHAIAISQK